MELSNMSIGTQSRSGQGLGTLAEVSIVAKFEGFSASRHGPFTLDDSTEGGSLLREESKLSREARSGH